MASMTGSDRHRATAWYAGLAIGATVVVVLALSMFAAHDTQRRATRAQQPFVTVSEAEMLASTSLCRNPTASGVLVVVTNEQLVEDARCLYQHGALTMEQLATVSRQLRQDNDPIVSPWFPLSLQVIPTWPTVALWVTLLAALVSIASWRVRQPSAN
jgi:hypothetical protein